MGDRHVPYCLSTHVLSIAALSAAHTDLTVTIHNSTFTLVSICGAKQATEFDGLLDYHS